MAKKTKINKTAAAITDTAANLGLVLMTAATTLGMVDVPQHPDKRVVLPTRPSFAFAGQNAESELQSSTLRREREETGPHYISYNVAQRTPGRTGKV